MSDPLKTAVCAGYTDLGDLLVGRRWREADEETDRVMCEVRGRESLGWLCSKDIQQFPCNDLRFIDQLWVKYSGGHFGFSVQKRIYESVGGTEKYDSKVWEKFGDRVGWRSQGKWLHYSELIFDLTEAPIGHLPHLPWLLIFERSMTNQSLIPANASMGWLVFSAIHKILLFTRAKDCRL